MAVDIDALCTGLIGAVESHALALGVFDAGVNGHEPVSSPTPGNGMAFAVWFQRIAPDPEDSGLATGSPVIVMQGRIYLSADQQPYDGIDPAMLSATMRLMAALSADYTLGGLVRNIGLNGTPAPGLSAEAGYVTDPVANAKYRVMTITIPCVVNDVWLQAPGGS